jgi:ribosomal protein S18 acetylase RimI-like enzyme
MAHIIRKATQDDAGRLAELAGVTFPLACPPGSSPADIAAHLANTLSEEHFRIYAGDPDITILVIEEEAITGPDAPSTPDGELRGYSMLIARPAQDPDVASALSQLPSAELSKCYLHPGYHGLGAAAELMRATVESAAADGALGLWLGVNSENAKAIRFYEKSGFRKVGTKTFKLGSTVEHDFVMERQLPA